MPRAIAAIKRFLFVRAPVADRLKLPRTCKSGWGDSCSEFADPNESSAFGLCNGNLPDDADEKLFGNFQCATLNVFLAAVELRTPCIAHRMWFWYWVRAAHVSSVVICHTSNACNLQSRRCSTTPTLCCAGSVQDQTLVRSKKAATEYLMQTSSCL